MGHWAELGRRNQAAVEKMLDLKGDDDAVVD